MKKCLCLILQISITAKRLPPLSRSTEVRALWHRPRLLQRQRRRQGPSRNPDRTQLPKAKAMEATAAKNTPMKGTVTKVIQKATDQNRKAMADPVNITLMIGGGK